MALTYRVRSVIDELTQDMSVEYDIFVIVKMVYLND